MEEIRKKLGNIWYYYKIPICIVIVVLLALIYLRWQDRGIAQEDYAVALVTSDYVSDEDIAALETSLARFGQDLNGDGTVTVQIKRYWVDLTGEKVTGDENALMGLDADLAGRKSGLLLMTEPEALRENSQAVGEPCQSCRDLEAFRALNLGHLTAAPRAGHPQEEAYRAWLAQMG